MKKKLFLILFFIGINFLFAKPFIYQNKNVIICSDCDQVIKDYNQTKCYSYKYHLSLFNIYLIDYHVNLNNYKKRYSFKDDKRIPKEYQNWIRCYYKSGYDRSHLFPDADADYNLTILKTTYLSSNIVPQLPRVNRYKIAKVERKERKLAQNYKVLVLTGVAHITNKKLKNYAECANIPNSYLKIIFYLKNNQWYLYKAYLVSNANISEINLNNLKKYLSYKLVIKEIHNKTLPKNMR